MRATGDKQEHVVISKVLQKQISMITNVLGFGILSIAILGALETHNAIVEICNIFSQEEFLIYSCPENIVQWKAVLKIIGRAI